MLYSRRDQVIGGSLDLYGEWAQDEMQLLARWFKPGDSVLDVRRNMGTHAVFFGLGVGPQGTVHCFEPQPPVARLLSANLCLNHLSWCEVHPAGVSDAPGEAWIPRYNYDIVRNYGAVPLDGYNAANRVTAEEMSERVKIPLMTIDSLHLPRCELVKIDAEGMELRVLQGAEQLIARARPVIYAENNARDRSAPVLEWLLARGYRVYFHLARAFNPDNFLQNPHNYFGDARELNICAVPAERAIAIPELREAHGRDDYPET